MKFDFPKKIRRGYLIAFLLLLLCYFLSLFSFVQLGKQNKWVGHTREVINELGSLNANLKDAEINWHEYLLSKEDGFLRAYTESKNLVDSMYLVLLKSVSDNPEERDRVASMHALIVRKYQALDEELQIFDKNHLEVNDSLLIKEQRNKNLIDSIGQVSATITASEKKLLFERMQRVLIGFS